MAKNYEIVKNSPILYYMTKNLLTKSDICRHLDIRIITLNDYKILKILIPINITK